MILHQNARKFLKIRKFKTFENVKRLGFEFLASYATRMNSKLFQWAIFSIYKLSSTRLKKMQNCSFHLPDFLLFFHLFCIFLKRVPLYFINKWSVNGHVECKWLFQMHKVNGNSGEYSGFNIRFLTCHQKEISKSGFNWWAELHTLFIRILIWWKVMKLFFMRKFNI